MLCLSKLLNSTLFVQTSAVVKCILGFFFLVLSKCTGSIFLCHVYNILYITHVELKYRGLLVLKYHTGAGSSPPCHRMFRCVSSGLSKVQRFSLTYDMSAVHLPFAHLQRATGFFPSTFVIHLWFLCVLSIFTLLYRYWDQFLSH